MSFLAVALAFVLTMLVVATIVTQVVNLIQGMGRVRSAHLRTMLTEYVEKELHPVVRRELCRVRQDLSEEVAEEIHELAGRVRMAIRPRETEPIEPETEALFDEDELVSIVDVTTEELTEKLKRSSFGRRVFTELGDRADTMFAELGHRFDLLGEKYSERFRAHTRRWAKIVALLLAVVVNIDSIRIINVFIRNDELTNSVVAELDAYVAEQIEPVKLESIERSAQDDPVTAIKEDLRRVEAQINVLANSGVPVGWGYFPHSMVFGEDNRKTSAAEWFTWILGVLLTTVLAGLGAPFWYDTLSGLTRAVRRARTPRVAAEREAARARP